MVMWKDDCVEEQPMFVEELIEDRWLELQKFLEEF